MAFKTKAEKRAFKIGLLRGQKKNKGKAGASCAGGRRKWKCMKLLM